MSIPPRLSVKFNDVLGADAAHDLVNWMDEVRGDLAELRHEVHSMRSEMGFVRSDLATIRIEIATMTRESNERFAAMTRESNEKFAAMTSESNGKFAAMTSESNGKFNALVASIHVVDQRLAHSRGQFIAWSSAFWLTAVTAIVGLLQFLGH